MSCYQRKIRVQSTRIPRLTWHRLLWFMLIGVTATLLTTRTALAQDKDHTVQPGESLSTIAHTYGTDVTTLMRINGISDPNWIRSGQKLAVPGGPIGSGAGRTLGQETTNDSPLLRTGEETRLYAVQPGDTLAIVAAHVGTTAARLAELNQRSPASRLHRGELLRVPVTAHSDFPLPVEDDIPSTGRYYVHTVADKESLATIAANYGSSTRQILKVNDLDSAGEVKAGMRIVVPPLSFAEIFADIPLGEYGVPEYPVVPTTAKWISVDLNYQRAYAWEGSNLIKKFAISSGKSRTPTVTGDFRIWAKIPSQTMEGGSWETGDYYNLPNVQWVQYFYQDYAFHGAYWHNKFGVPTSHGCVNLTNADAKWLYEWASPTVTEHKWHVTDRSDPGTLVIVHP